MVCKNDRYCSLILFLGFACLKVHTLQMFTGIYRCFMWKSGCMLPTIPIILKSPHPDFLCNICRKFDSTGILWGSCISSSKIMYQPWGNHVTIFTGKLNVQCTLDLVTLLVFQKTVTKSRGVTK